MESGVPSERPDAGYACTDEIAYKFGDLILIAVITTPLFGGALLQRPASPPVPSNCAKSAVTVRGPAMVRNG